LQVIDLQGFSPIYAVYGKAPAGSSGHLLPCPNSGNPPQKPAKRAFPEPGGGFRFRIKSRTNPQKTLASPGKAQHY
jgi:hypothetical protein